MATVSLSHVSHHYEGPPILHDVTLDVNKGDKIGVIGRNGAGKSTLLKVLAGRLDPVEGQVFRQRGLRLAYQDQELVYRPGASVMEEMERVFEEHRHREAKLREIEQRLAEVEDDEEQAALLREYDRLQALMHAEGAYDVRQRIASVLSGLGLPESAWSQPIASFSGGERNVIGIARILLSQPDVILFDEPSNHLDLDGTEWFIRFVRQSPATIVMVSHDRHLLDATVGTIWEVDGASVTSWTGNYADFTERKAEALALQERQYKNQQRLIKRLEFQARRLRDMARAYDDPGQAKRAKAMLRRIEQMEKVERPRGEDRVFAGRLSGGPAHGALALAVRDLSVSFGSRVIFDHAELEITQGQRVCLLGPNGSGKTTLFRRILEEGSWENPHLRLGRAVRLGDYNQFHEEALDLDLDLWSWAQRVTGLGAQAASELLHRFLFTRDDLERKIATLSGGEKSRLQLARLVNDRVNFLLLDEPTNHLDIPSSERLEQMLEEFEGTLLVISHDRYFLEQLVDVVVEVRDRRLVTYRGTFAEWWERRQAEAATRSAGTLKLHSQNEAARREGKRERRDTREEKKAWQREQRRLRNRAGKLEEEIEALEGRKEEIARALEAAYSRDPDPPEAAGLSEELQGLPERLEALYREWEEVSEGIVGES